MKNEYHDLSKVVILSASAAAALSLLYSAKCSYITVVHSYAHSMPPQHSKITIPISCAYIMSSIVICCISSMKMNIV